MLCGMNSFSEIVEFVELQEVWFKKWITLPNGIPTQQTFSNIFQLINPAQFSECLRAHVSQLFPELACQLIAIDGKALRGSGTLKSRSVHCLSAWSAEAGVTLGLEYVEEKSNEIAAIPKLLEHLELKGHIVSIDAMGTQTAIAKEIIDAEADYLMALKANQSGLHNEVIDQFQFASRQIKMAKSESWSVDEVVNKANGRITTRKVAVTNNLDWMVDSVRKRWSGLKSLIMVESTTVKMGGYETKTQRRYYISSLEAGAAKFQELIRGHWSIENQCHWVLDTLFREDHQQIHAKLAAKNMGILRRIVLNLLKHDTLIEKTLPKKQLNALMNIEYRERILSLA